MSYKKLTTDAMDGEMGGRGVSMGEVDAEDLNEAAADAALDPLPADQAAPPLANEVLAADCNDFGCPLDFLASVCISV